MTKREPAENGASKKASAGGRRDGKVTAGNFKPLPKTATLDERAAYIRKHAGAAKRCRRLELGYSWCAGVEIAKVKNLTGLTGKEWDAHCDETFGFTSRHARDFTALAKAFSTVEEMLNVVKEASFATAVVIARSLIHPESETIDPPDDTKPDGTDGPGDDPPPPPPPAAPTPDRSREVADLVDEIQRITGQMGDQHLGLLRRVHRLLTASRKGRSESKGNAKRRKTK